MKLKKLIKNLSVIQIKGSKEIDITGMTANSKVVSPGNLFLAKKGKTYDGFQFIPEAVSAGANAVVTELYDPSLQNVTQIVVKNVQALEGELASRYYDHPSDDLFMVGVTGTNGKTTTTFFVKHFLEMMGKPCGVIGTVEYMVGALRYTATHTTPDVITNQRMLREMCLQKCQAAVMEVTSHALDQDRVDKINYDVAIYTNLSHEHLDYHKTLGEYADAKAKLFTSLTEDAYAVINSDCPWASRVTGATKAQKITYGLVSQADLQASNIRLNAEGTEISLTWRNESVEAFLPCIGEFNIYNALAAAAVPLIRGVNLQEVASWFSSLPRVPGRLERVKNSHGLSVFVDFAHTSDALQHALQAVRPLTKGRLYVVFGCGGERDQEKRPIMGSVAEKFADEVILTTDNPRKEDPVQILKEISKGLLRSHRIIADRREAIRTAIAALQKDDLLLIAGRGCERSQIFANHLVDFHDPTVAEELCR